MNILVKNSTQTLSLSYKDSNEHTIFDVCDLDGRIRETGKFDDSGNATVDISKLRKGAYHIFIIDQGEVFKQRIEIPSA